MVQKIWERERAIILSNLKKLKKGYGFYPVKKDAVDSILYPKRQFIAELSEEARKLLIYIMAKEGQYFLDELDIDAVFNVLNPNVTKWLKEYTPKFSKNLEEVNIEELRKQLIEGLEVGESIPNLAKRVNETYDNWTKYRSEMIARSETIRASNEAALESYRQSEVVKYKVWLAAIDACDACLELSDQVLELEGKFFSDDFSTGECPPLHPNCRCAVSAWIED
jgi:SPP1 gp7 family putative phage head morphogenesis protein